MFFRRKPKEPKIAGYIGHHGLTDWWLKELTADERQLIEEKYMSMHQVGTATLTTGKAESSSDAFKLLHGIAGWFLRKDQTPIALKLLKKASEFNASFTDLHFYYGTYIEARYKQRNDDPQALNDTIAICEQMIAIAPQVAQEFRQDYGHLDGRSVPPRHKGYEQLIVIRKKQKDAEEAQRLQEEFEHIWGD